MTHTGEFRGDCVAGFLRAEEGEDGVYALVVERTLGEAQLLEDVVGVSLDGFGRDEESLRDPAVGEALGHQAKDVALAWGEFVEWVCAAAALEQLCDKGGIDDHSAGDDAGD